MNDIPVVILNMERSRHRRAFMTRQLKGRGLDYRFFPAIDGYALMPKQKALYDEPLAIQWSGRPLRLTEMGTALSHKSAYEWMIKEGIQRALVCEDDSYFKAEFYIAWPSIEEWLPVGWGMVNFAVTAFDPFSLSAYQAHRRGPKLYPIAALPDYYVLRCVNHTITATCYLITLSAAERLLALAPKIHLPADELIGLVHSHRIPTYTTLPPLVQLTELASTINEGRANREVKQRLEGKPSYTPPARPLMHHRPIGYRVQRIFIYLSLAFRYAATRREIPHRLFLFVGDAYCHLVSKLYSWFR